MGRFPGSDKSGRRGRYRREPVVELRLVLGARRRDEGGFELGVGDAAADLEPADDPRVHLVRVGLDVLAPDAPASAAIKIQFG